MENDILNFAKELVNSNIYLAFIFFFLNACLQVLFPPYPGDSIIILEGYLASKEIVATIPVLITTLAGTFLASILLYNISLRLEKRLVNNAYFKSLFNVNRLEKIEGWFKRFGAAAIIVTKFVPGLASLAVIAAGIFEVPKKSAYIAIAASVIVQNSILFVAGGYTGYNMEKIKYLIARYDRHLIVIISIGAIIFVVYKLTKFLAKNKRSRSN